MATNYAISKTNQMLVEKSEAMKKISEHNRDYLSLSLTLPLGNPALKKVHTNQWLFTNLPKKFDLANWTIIADALQSNTNRYEGYIKNRWYIESNEISVEAGGKAEMKLGLNAFASSYSGYSQTAKDIQKAYRDAEDRYNQYVKSNSNKSNSNNTTNAVTTKKSVLNKKWIKKYKVPKAVYTQAEKICKVKYTELQNAQAIWKWMDNHISWVYYENHKHSESNVLRNGRGNCVDNSRLYRAFCHSIGLKCNYIKNSCISHQYNKVYCDGKGYIVDVGRELASWGSHWGSGGCPVESSVSWGNN